MIKRLFWQMGEANSKSLIVANVARIDMAVRGIVGSSSTLPSMKRQQTLSFQITDEHAHGSELFIPLLKEIDTRIGPGRIKKALSDRSFDSKSNYNYSEKRGSYIRYGRGLTPSLTLINL
ncbi:MAG: hypothetical protein NC238_16195 [Dehalobacter sp.]|nr:hypothetical protein [Dehalobacter sp.]